jgi:perosamine synthetase
MIMDRNKERVLIPPHFTIRETLRAIDSCGLAIVLVVDEQRRLLGTVTDGDVRRAILNGIGLDSKVSGIMNRNPITVSPTTDTQDIRRIFVEASIKQIPIVDSDGRVLDLVLIGDLLAVPLSNPDITDREVQAVLEVLQTSHLSLGPRAVEFERRMARFVGRRFAIAVNSGTAGLHLVVKSLGIGPGDEVITTPFSFIASSNCLLYENATPVFVDVDPRTYNLDPSRIEAAITPRTRGILAVDVFGQPACYDEIESIARKHHLWLVCDSCESIGARYLNRPAGSFGLAGVFAFYPNKQITTGEGGIIVTDDPQIDKLCRSMRNQGRSETGGWLMHERLGYNYRLPELSCALGIVQLDRIQEILDRRANVAEAYGRALKDLPDVHLPWIHPHVSRMSWFVYVIRLADRFTRGDRDKIMQTLARRGVGTNSYFQPIHLQPFYRARFGFKEGDFPVAEAASHRTLALPFHNRVTEDEVTSVVARLSSAIREVSTPS